MSDWFPEGNIKGPKGDKGDQGDASTVPGPPGTTTWDGITDKPATFPPTLPIPQSGVTNLTSDLALKAPLASPVFTGNPLAPTPPLNDNDTSIATTAFTQAAIASFAVTQDTRDDAQDAAIATKLGDAPSDGLTYGRKNATWSTIVGGAVIADTPPPGPLQAGQLYWESDSGDMYIWFVDANSSQWVQVNGPGLPTVSIGDAPPASPLPGNLWWQSSTGRLYCYYNDGDSSQWTHIAGPLAARTGQWDLLGEQESIANAVQQLNFDGFPDPTVYDHLKWDWQITGLASEVAGVYPYIRVRNAGVDITGTAYSHASSYVGTGGSISGYGSTASGAANTVIAFVQHTAVPAVNFGGVSRFEIDLPNPRYIGNKQIAFHFKGNWYVTSGGGTDYSVNGVGAYGSGTAAYDGVAFKMGAANFTGKVKMWGRRL